MIDRAVRFVSRIVAAGTIVYYGAHLAIAQTSTLATLAIASAAIAIAVAVDAILAR